MIKTKMYDSKTYVIPQVIAYSLPYSIEEAKALIESSLHKKPVMLINSKGEIDFKDIIWKQK